MKNRFSHNLVRVLGGAGTAQLLNVFSVYVVSVFFQPVVVGAASVANALISTLGCFASLRYNQAILLPRQHCNAGRLIRLSLWIGAFFSFLVLLLGILAYPLLAPMLKIPLHWSTLLVVPVGVFLVAWFNILSSLSNRMNRFGIFSVSRIMQSAIKASLLTLFGAFLYQGEQVLVLANLVGILFAILFLWKLMAPERSICHSYPMSLKRYAALMKRNREFPLFSAPVALMTDLEASAPLYLFAFYYNAELVGQFAFAYAAIRMGTAILADSFRRVFYTRLAEMKHKKTIWMPLVTRFIFVISGVLSMTYGTFYLCGEELFLLVFGDKWATAGGLAVLLSALMGFYALAESLQSVFVVLSQQRQLFNLKMAGATLTIVGVSITLWKGMDIREAIVTFTILGCLSKTSVILLAIQNVRRYDEGLAPG